MKDKNSSVLFQRIAFIGFGLIGSSLARVVRRRGLAGHIAVCTRRRETLDRRGPCNWLIASALIPKRWPGAPTW